MKRSEGHKAISQEIKASGKAIFSYESQGETWWAGVTSYPLGKKRHLWIGILVPNDDLLEGITQLRLHILAATLVTLLAALAYSFLLARSYSQPLEALAAQSRRIRDLDFQTDEKIEAKLREFKQLEEAQAQSLAALQSFSRYVPLEIVKELMAKGEVARIGGHTETLTILFTDIAGFTNISEAMSPEALTNHLAGYFQAMIDALHHHGATVDKIVGDAIVAFWGAPTPMPDQTDRALKAVLECRDTLEELKSNLARPGLAGTPDPLRPGHRTGGGGQYGGPDPAGLHGTGGHGESGQPPGRPEQGLRYQRISGYRHAAGRRGRLRHGATSTGSSSPARPRPPIFLKCWVRPGKFPRRSWLRPGGMKRPGTSTGQEISTRPWRNWRASRPSSGRMRRWSACGKPARRTGATHRKRTGTEFQEW